MLRLPTLLTILFLLFALPFASMAQHRDTLRRMVEFQLTVGSSTNRQLRFSPDTWNKLTPGYSNPDVSDTAFHRAGRYGIRYGSDYAAVNVNLSLRIRELQARGLTPILGFTIGSAQGARSSADWWKSESYRVDTLSSNQNGAQYYVDSVVQQSYSKQFQSNQYFIGSRFVLQTNRAKRISALFGIQVNVGISTNSRTDISHSLDQHTTAYPVSQSGTGEQVYYFPWNYQTVAVVSRSTNWYYGFSVPLGMDVRLSKRENLLGKMTVGLEMAVGGTWVQIPDAGVYGTPTFNFGFTYKYRFS